MKTPGEWAAGIRYAGPQSVRNLAAVVEALTLAVAEARAEGEAAGRAAAYKARAAGFAEGEAAVEPRLRREMLEIIEREKQAWKAAGREAMRAEAIAAVERESDRRELASRTAERRRKGELQTQSLFCYALADEIRALPVAPPVKP
jgi:hypothetical protein